MANPKYGTTVPSTTLELQPDKKVLSYWVESLGGADVVYFTVDGTEPEVGADGNYFLPAAGGSLAFAVPGGAARPVVKFISAAAVKVSVRY